MEPDDLKQCFGPKPEDTPRGIVHHIFVQGMPGYLPSDEPVVFNSHEEAVDYAQHEFKDWMDYFGGTEEHEAEGNLPWTMDINCYPCDGVNCDWLDNPEDLSEHGLEECASCRGNLSEHGLEECASCRGRGIIGGIECRGCGARGLKDLGQPAGGEGDGTGRTASTPGGGLRTCPRCGGSGALAGWACSGCGGSGDTTAWLDDEPPEAWCPACGQPAAIDPHSPVEGECGGHPYGSREEAIETAHLAGEDHSRCHPGGCAEQYRSRFGCGSCRGRGTINSIQCRGCGGSGWQSEGRARDFGRRFGGSDGRAPQGTRTGGLRTIERLPGECASCFGFGNIGDFDCRKCAGTGFAEGYGECEDCGGTGWDRVEANVPCARCWYGVAKLAHVGDDAADHHAIGTDKFRAEHPYYDECLACSGTGMGRDARPCGSCSGFGEVFDDAYWDTDEQLHDFRHYPAIRRIGPDPAFIEEHLRSTHGQSRWKDPWVHHQGIHGFGRIDPEVAGVLLPSQVRSSRAGTSSRISSQPAEGVNLMRRAINRWYKPNTSKTFRVHMAPHDWEGVVVHADHELDALEEVIEHHWNAGHKGYFYSGEDLEEFRRSGELKDLELWGDLAYGPSGQPYDDNQVVVTEIPRSRWPSPSPAQLSRHVRNFHPELPLKSLGLDPDAIEEAHEYDAHALDSRPFGHDYDEFPAVPHSPCLGRGGIGLECRGCGGSGIDPADEAGEFRDCLSCRGYGKLGEIECRNCGGFGVVRKPKEAAWSGDAYRYSAKEFDENSEDAKEFMRIDKATQAKEAAWSGDNRSPAKDQADSTRADLPQARGTDPWPDAAESGEVRLRRRWDGTLQRWVADEQAAGPIVPNYPGSGTMDQGVYTAARRPPSRFECSSCWGAGSIAGVECRGCGGLGYRPHEPEFGYDYPYCGRCGYPVEPRLWRDPDPLEGAIRAVHPRRAAAAPAALPEQYGEERYGAAADRWTGVGRGEAAFKDLVHGLAERFEQTGDPFYYPSHTRINEALGTYPTSGSGGPQLGGKRPAWRIEVLRERGWVKTDRPCPTCGEFGKQRGRVPCPASTHVDWVTLDGLPYPRVPAGARGKQCSSCRGKGTINSIQCRGCGGSGYTDPPCECWGSEDNTIRCPEDEEHRSTWPKYLPPGMDPADVRARWPKPLEPKEAARGVGFPASGVVRTASPLNCDSCRGKGEIGGVKCRGCASTGHSVGGGVVREEFPGSLREKTAGQGEGETMALNWTQSVDPPPEARRGGPEPWRDVDGQHLLVVRPPRGRKRPYPPSAFPGNKPFAEQPHDQSRMDSMPQIVGRRSGGPPDASRVTASTSVPPRCVCHRFRCLHPGAELDRRCPSRSTYWVPGFSWGACDKCASMFVNEFFVHSGKNCPSCQGIGEIGGVECRGCGGSGVVETGKQAGTLPSGAGYCDGCLAESTPLRLVPAEGGGSRFLCRSCDWDRAAGNPAELEAHDRHWRGIPLLAGRAVPQPAACPSCRGLGGIGGIGCRGCGATGTMGMGSWRSAAFYDPIRDVQPSPRSAPAPSAGGDRTGDPWFDEADNGASPPRPGWIWDPELRKWIRENQSTWPSEPFAPGWARTDVNKLGM